jgi:hypothetical protein
MPTAKNVSNEAARDMRKEAGGTVFCADTATHVTIPFVNSRFDEAPVFLIVSGGSVG